MARTPFLTLLAVVLALLTTPSRADAQDADGSRSTIDLEFSGGTAIEYVEAIRRAAGDLNVVIRDDARHVRVDAVEMRRVDPESALRVLDKLELQLDDKAVALEVEVMRSPLPGARPLYTINAHVNQLRRPRSALSRVWATTALVNEASRAEDMLTAVETSLELLEDRYPAVRMRYHRETGLLIARGQPEQLEAIESVMLGLHESVPPSVKVSREADRVRLEADTRIEMLERRLAATTDQMQDAVRALASYQTRAEMFEREIRSLQERLDQTAQEHRAAMTERNAQIAELKHQLLQATRGGNR